MGHYQGLYLPFNLATLLTCILIYEQNTLQYPDERQITKGIKFTDVPTHLQSLVDALVWESTRTEEGYVVFCRHYWVSILSTNLQTEEQACAWSTFSKMVRNPHFNVNIVTEMG